ncbi:MAG TPA: hypothetical protein VLG14_17795 [Sphingomonas sp.]|nr:hypothetical protein [Sphingomonas sp.]
MKFGCLFLVTTFITAALAGIGHFSFWWSLLPAFLSGSFYLADGPSYGTILRANQEGRLTVFPMMLAFSMLAPMAMAGGIYWIARALS